MDNYVLEMASRSRQVAPEEIPAAEPVEREKSIAVLPFDNISPNPEDAYFADGIHDEILAQISKIRDIKVTSRTSVMRYRGEDKPSSPEIGVALGVANLLEGSVRLAGNRVRITIQFIEAERDAHLWTEIYDRELTAANIFSIQSEIATMVADALRATLTPEEQEQLATVPTENLAAYDAYLIGRQRLAKQTTEAVVEAIDYFEQATELDPGFALAYVGSAEGYFWQADSSGLPPEKVLAKAESAADMALELDDQLGEAYSVLAAIQHLRNDFEAAEATYQRALELSPNYATAYYGYGALLRGSLGRSEEALPLIRKSVELDPLWAPGARSLGDSFVSLGQFEEGLAWFKRAIELAPGYAGGYESISLHYWYVVGQLDEAVVWQRRAISVDPGVPVLFAELGWLYLNLGDLDEADYWIYRSFELGPENYWPNMAMQILHLYRGDEAAAIEYGRKALALYPFNWGALSLLGDSALRAGRYVEARTLYEQIFPDLLNSDDPEIDFTNYRKAINLALVLSKTGEQQRADLLLDRSLQLIQTRPRLGNYGYEIADVQIYALQGQKQKALAALRQAIDEGFCDYNWWYHFKQNPTLESLHDEPEYPGNGRRDRSRHGRLS